MDGDLGEVMRIVILQLSGIGNMIMLTPTVMSLRACFQGARITLLVRNNGAQQILSGLPRIDVITVDPTDLRHPLKLVFLAQRLRRQRPDIFFLAYPSQEFRGVVLARLAGAKVVVAHPYRFFGKPCRIALLTYWHPLDRTVHEVMRNLHLVQAIGLNPPEVIPTAFIEEIHRKKAKKFIEKLGLGRKRPLAGMHLGSDQELDYKRWPVEHFAQVADQLVQVGCAGILLLGGSGEVPIAERFIRLVSNHGAIYDFVGKTTIKEAAALIEQLDLFVSNDSGLMHMAAAVRTPVVGIFGPTDPVKNAPFTPSSLSKVVRLDLRCSPCYIIGAGTRCREMHCLKNLKPKRVIEAAKEILVVRGKLR